MLATVSLMAESLPPFPATCRASIKQQIHEGVLRAFRCTLVDSAGPRQAAVINATESQPKASQSWAAAPIAGNRPCIPAGGHRRQQLANSFENTLWLLAGMANWYITLAGVELGPIRDNHLWELARSGRLRPGDHVRKSGMTHAVEAARIKGLFDCRPQHAERQLAEPLTTFSAWYRQYPGRWPFWAQLIAWFLYGFLWIPAWWALDLICSQDDEVQQFGRRVLETVGCIAIVVSVAANLKQQAGDQAEPPAELRRYPGTTAMADASP